MGRKANYTKQQKVQACEDHFNKTKSASPIVKELNMGKRGYKARRADRSKKRCLSKANIRTIQSTSQSA